MAVRKKPSALVAVLCFLIKPFKLICEWTIILLFYLTLPLTRHIFSRCSPVICVSLLALDGMRNPEGHRSHCP